MDMTAREIQEKQFHDAWKGYRQDEVDDFLDQVSEALDHAQRENAALQVRINELEQAVSTARDTEEMLKKTLVTAQRAAEEAIASAKSKADRIVVEAEEDAARIRGEAEERMGSADAEARRKLLEADRATELRTRELESSIERLQAHERELKGRLKTFLEQQLKALNALEGEAVPVRRRAGAGGTAAPAGAGPSSSARAQGLTGPAPAEGTEAGAAPGNKRVLRFDDEAPGYRGSEEPSSEGEPRETPRRSFRAFFSREEARGAEPASDPHGEVRLDEVEPSSSSGPDEPTQESDIPPYESTPGNGADGPATEAGDKRA